MNTQLDWTQKEDEMNAQGWKVEGGRIVDPNGFRTEEMPRHWTTEQCVNRAYEHFLFAKDKTPIMAH